MIAIIVSATRALPRAIGTPAGRNVETAPTAKIQTFGFTSWNADRLEEAHRP